MKKLILPFVLILVFQGTDTGAQSQIDMCEGTGQHCMNIVYGSITLSLVKGRMKPEIIIKPIS